ncbi:MAG: DUF2442 domain-containing protein [Lachnospiraceae bacterium]|nr:DUF2442 domain-containing protein [Lachnospiraceae bacterium]
MKIYAIRDESAEKQKDLAYLFYYELEKRFYIELPDGADPWELPLLLDSFVRQNETTVNSYWSKVWVQQRIIPIDRQNIGQILRDNQLEEYDEYELLTLAMGRCAQDDYYLVPIDEKYLPEEIRKRFATKIEDVLPLEDYGLLVFFRDGVIKKCDLKKYFEKTPVFHILLKKPEYFEDVQMQTGGYGISWDVNMTVSDSMLYRLGMSIPLTVADFRNFVTHRVINVAKAAEILGCSRQNILDLTKRGKLHPLKTSDKNTLYLKSEILKRNWQ